MYFEYEITQEEYVAGQILYSKLNGARGHFQVVVLCILTGIALVATALILSAPSEKVDHWIPILLVALGVLWICGGVVNLSASKYFRRAYRRTELAGKTFKADVNDKGFEVTGDLCSWRVQWPSVRFKGEDDCVFMFNSEGTIFMFGKKFLSDEQQQELRRLSALGISDH